jgi:hypothetical protein
VQDVEKSWASVYKAANISMVQAYWNIGRLILEEDRIWRIREDPVFRIDNRKLGSG